MLETHRKRVEMLKAWAQHDASAFHRFQKTIGRSGLDLKTSSVLDLGCGSNAPMTVLLHSMAVKVTGVDAEVGHRWGLGFRPSRYVSYVREAGVLKTARKFLGECVYDRTYYRALEGAVGFPLLEAGLDLRRMDVSQLQFSDCSFDIVHSNATWEHLSDVRTADRELARVLRPGGIAYIEIHLFPSLSGGHDLPWIVPGRLDVTGVKPWQHLRDPEWQAPVYLNRHREHEFEEFFRGTAGLEVLDWITEFSEGAELLNDDIRREVSGYSDDELTRRSIIAVVAKVSTPGAQRA